MTSEQLNLITAITSFLGLILVIIGWLIASHTANKQVKKQIQITTDYEIYKNVLIQVNQIIGKIVSFQTSINSHTTKMADILNEVHATPSPSPARQNELVDSWGTETKQLVENGYAIEESIIEFMRSLDMSGTNFHSDTKVYKALLIVQHDASEAIRSITRKWINLNLDSTTVPQYDDLKLDTQRDLVPVNALAQCIEDILKLIFNDIVVKNSSKKIKSIDLSEKRKIITLNGLVDNRLN